VSCCFIMAFHDDGSCVKEWVWGWG
jgi:hypothetical protein